MKKYLFVLTILFFASFQAHSQSSKYIELETQWYPAGYQFMLSGEYGFTGKDALHVKLGYNLALRKDFSPYNDLEEGGGFGFSLGYRHYLFGDSNNGVYAGVRTDMWWLSIDWEDATATSNTGTTKITVFQPTAEIGYLYQFSDSPLAIGANAAAGYEINIITNGDPVGQGAMGLLGVRIRYFIGE